jgi:AraC-like DNA-binding protein
VAGGFADQAHFTREMRRMMGLTPAEVVRAIGPGAPWHQPRRAV